MDNEGYDAATEQFQLMGKYALREKLGQGGMGEVWLGHHPDFNIPVAIKTIRADKSDPEYAGRFLQEARTAALINHPRIARIFDAGTQGDVQYIVMEYLPGGTIGEILEETGLLDIAMAVYVASAVAEGLGAAAEQGIIHRDVKPDNIMLDAKGEPKLVDLGLAKEVNSNSQLTTQGMIMGTPAYISPEQAKNAAIADHRADIYSLGATLFHMLTGQPPYEASTPMATALCHFMDPVPDPESIKPDLPKALCDTVRKMMAKKPEQRYQSSQEVIKALRTATRGGNRSNKKKMLRKFKTASPKPIATTAKRPPAMAPASVSKTPNRRGWKIMAILALLVLGLGFFVFRPPHDNVETDRQASQPTQNDSQRTPKSKEPARIEASLVGFYDFRGPATPWIRDAADKDIKLDFTDGAQKLPGKLRIANAKSIALAQQTPQKMLQKVTAKNEITIEAWLRPENLKQEGPARIVTYSRDTSARNFTLGQEGGSLDVRLRTTKSGENGTPSLQAPKNSLPKALIHVVFTRAKNGKAVLYQDSKIVAKKTIPGDFSNWNKACKLAIGNEVTKDRPWLGEIYLVALYDRALNPNEVSQNFNAGIDNPK